MPGLSVNAEHLRVFQRAVRDNCTMVEARRRIAEELWAATAARLDRRRAGQHEEPAEQPVQWWQRD